MCSLTRPMILLLSIVTLTLTLGVGAAALRASRRRRAWQATERLRIERRYLEQTRRRQRKHDFLIDQALLSGAFTERKNGGN